MRNIYIWQENLEPENFYEIRRVLAKEKYFWWGEHSERDYIICTKKNSISSPKKKILYLNLKYFNQQVTHLK